MALAGLTNDTVVRFRITQLSKLFADHVAGWQEARQGIIKRFAVHEDGQPQADANGLIVWQTGKADEALRAVEELGATETDLNPPKIKLSKLAASTAKPIDFQILSAMDWLIEDDAE